MMLDPKNRGVLNLDRGKEQPFSSYPHQGKRKQNV